MESRHIPFFLFFSFFFPFSFFFYKKKYGAVGAWGGGEGGCCLRACVGRSGWMDGCYVIHTYIYTCVCVYRWGRLGFMRCLATTAHTRARDRNQNPNRQPGTPGYGGGLRGVFFFIVIIIIHYLLLLL